VAIAKLLAALFVDHVDLPEHNQARGGIGTDLAEHLVHGPHHRQTILLRGRTVDNVQDQAGEPCLFEGRAERFDELVRKLADEADGVCEQVVAPAGPQDPGGRVKCVEEPIANADLGTGEGVQQR
jgi:hypothetical protein